MLKNRDVFRALLVDRLIAERDRWILWLPVSMAAGVAVYFGLAAEPPYFLGALGLMVTGGLAWVTRLGRSYFWLFAISLFAFSLGFSASQWRTFYVAAPVVQKRLSPVSLEGRVVNIETRQMGLRVTFDHLRISTLGPRMTPNKVRLKLVGKQPHLSLGDWVRGRVGLLPPPPPAAPGAFDFQRKAFFQGIGGVGFSFGPVTVSKKASSDGLSGLLSAVINLRHDIALRVSGYFSDGGHAKTGQVVAALMTGERGGIPSEVMDSFRKSGLAHLLAISGLHIGLIAGIVFFGVRTGLALAGATALNFPVKKWAALAALAGAFSYALMAGATVPTIRAFLMIALVLVAVLFDRRGLSLRLVGFAASAILLVHPEALLGASFQLSFAAVIALIAAYEALSRWRQTRGRAGFSSVPGWQRPLLYFAGVGLTTLIAGAATAPFAAYHFNQFPHYGVLANLIAVPLTALWIMPWAVIAFALLPFGLESVALTPMGWGVDLVLVVAEWISHWPGAVSLLPATPGWALISMALGGLWLCLWRTRWRLLGISGLLAGVAALGFVNGPDVLIDHSGRVMAVKDAAGGLAVSSLRAGRFTSGVWLRRAALDAASPWPGPRPGSVPRTHAVTLSCDGLGCLYATKGKNIALVTDIAALQEDCATADIVLSTIATRGHCRGPDLVIDRFDLWRNGTHALWIGKQEIRVESVNGQRGDRPWVQRPDRGMAAKGGT